MLNVKIVTWSLGIFTAISFVLCVAYGVIAPANLHMAPFLEMVLPAFKWLTFGGFCMGLIESFLYGVYAGLVFVPIYNLLARRWGAAAAQNV
jgi:antibiotic biosynthesis monooxygenase (ABM) superfamily enzyme